MILANLVFIFYYYYVFIYKHKLNNFFLLKNISKIKYLISNFLFLFTLVKNINKLTCTIIKKKDKFLYYLIDLNFFFTSYFSSIQIHDTAIY